MQERFTGTGQLTVQVHIQQVKTVTSVLVNVQIYASVNTLCKTCARQQLELC